MCLWLAQDIELPHLTVRSGSAAPPLALCPMCSPCACGWVSTQALFHAMKIDGESLLQLTDRDLQAELGVSKRADRALILQELDVIKQRGGGSTGELGR